MYSIHDAANQMDAEPIDGPVLDRWRHVRYALGDGVEGIRALGWRTEESSKRRYLPLQDWYLRVPTAKFPTLPDRDYLEII
jgi:hypothetical protein